MTELASWLHLGEDSDEDFGAARSSAVLDLQCRTSTTVEVRGELTISPRRFSQSHIR